MPKTTASEYGFKRHMSVTVNPRWTCAQVGCAQHNTWYGPSAHSREDATNHTSLTGHPTFVSRETVDSYVARRDPEQLKTRE